MPNDFASARISHRNDGFYPRHLQSTSNRLGLPHPLPTNFERIQFFIGRKRQVALSAKTNAAKLIAARTKLQQRVSALSAAGAQSA